MLPAGWGWRGRARMKSPSTSSVNHLALGKSCALLLRGFLQQQLRRGVHLFSRGASIPICAFGQRQAARLVGFVAHLGAQCL